MMKKPLGNQRLKMVFSRYVSYFSRKHSVWGSFWLMYHFHAAEKSAHASLHVTRKHVNTQCDMFMLKYCGNTKSPPTPGQIGGYYNFKYQ